MNQFVRSLLLLGLLLRSPILAQEVAVEPAEKDVATFRQHVDWLASPFMKGRLPGTPEMAFARDYVEWHLRQAGLAPAFPASEENGAASFRQPFEIGMRRELSSCRLAATGVELTAGSDFRGMACGDVGKVTGTLVFAGYGIKDLGADWHGLDDDDRFDGKVVAIYAYGPMDDAGRSIQPGWRGNPWPRQTDPFAKGSTFRDRGAAAVLLVVPPGVADDGAGLDGIRDRGMQIWDCPVVMTTTAAFESLMKASGSEQSALELRRLADKGRCLVDLGLEVGVEVAIEATPRSAENVGGLLAGRGKLADQILVIGAHIDHLGLGQVGSRAGKEGRGKIHPGADDNASGTAAMMMLAERLVAHYRSQPEDADLRSILFLGFDAEEQGLLGSAHYVKAPIRPLDQHDLMINFDMIGRITERRLRVDGSKSAAGLEELLKPLFAGSGLEIVAGDTVMMASDHAPFYSAGVPVLFGIIDPFHNEYHTPADTADKMNCVDAVRVVELFDRIARVLAVHPGKLVFHGRRRN
ncbi:MAG: M28 family peptidase [Planctomycetes bacterium]|nr:M28 family peptidase [Planctomycetota bacterium]